MVFWLKMGQLWEMEGARGYWLMGFWDLVEKNLAEICFERIYINLVENITSAVFNCK